MAKVLLLAPQPFFQERGTPIAVKLLCEALASTPHLEVHLLTYLEGDDIALPSNCYHHRAWSPSWLYGVKPGISIKKLFLDLFFFFHFIKLVREINPTFVHAVEESAFMVSATQWIHKKDFFFDMDSKVVEQAISKWGFLSLLSPILNCIENFTITRAKAVIGVCPVLVEYAKQVGANKTFLLPDISLLEEIDGTPDLRRSLGIADADPLLLYVGNLEHYQGIDLLLESFQHTVAELPTAQLVLVGGRSEHIAQYREKSIELGFGEHCHFTGPKPSKELSLLFYDATAVVSPRIEGENTPMKLYSYLASGKPLVATSLTTHTQIIDDTHAFLGEPKPEPFAKAITEALKSSEKASQKASKALELVKSSYSKESFFKRVQELFSEEF